MMALAVALGVALLIDHFVGEPPTRLHPVVWIGNYLGYSGAWVQCHTIQQPQVRDLKAFTLAALVWTAGAVTAVGLAWLLQSLVLSLPWWAAGVLLGLLLKPLLAWAMLRSEVQAVEAALGESLEAGRERLSWLVSRDVSQLTETQVRESAIETLAENLNDSVVAPLFWFVLLGLPGAALYRLANTADAMWGYPGLYKGQNWAWAGKWAARVDDGLSYVPARLTALLLASLNGVGWSGLAREAVKTPSPNSGWPMAAMALALDVALRKPGVYVLNPQGRSAGPADTRAAQVFAAKALHAFVGLVLVVMALVMWWGR
jgi:adenosylcobinamide-phosphate synthase